MRAFEILLEYDRQVTANALGHKLVNLEPGYAEPDQVLEKLEDAQEMTQKEYEDLIKSVSGAYVGAKNASKKDLLEFTKEMKDHWRSIEKAAAPLKKSVKKEAKTAAKNVAKTAAAAAAVKTVKKVTKPAKKAVKKTTK
jgi:ABC-type transporter Mla subunit MlaD